MDTQSALRAPVRQDYKVVLEVATWDNRPTFRQVYRVAAFSIEDATFKARFKAHVAGLELVRAISVVTA